MRNLYGPGLIWRVRNGKNSLYLTFDDGPHPDVTPAVLDILDHFDVKATFFCVGDNVRKYPEVYAKVIGKGHRTGNHTFHHLNGWKSGFEDYIRDVEQCAGLVSGDLFRPPYGRITRRQAKWLKGKYRVIMWTALSGDFNRDLQPATCLSNALNISGRGDILVFHDSLKARENMLITLPLFLEECLGRGYEFRLL
ncbi:MAG: polysaccharide deacetylase family protein [Bacteroidetes bacterium]|nr:polysaccharide deacetylase family protein [Bacteroidota bacterium]